MLFDRNRHKHRTFDQRRAALQCFGALYFPTYNDQAGKEILIAIAGRKKANEAILELALGSVGRVSSSLIELSHMLAAVSSAETSEGIQLVVLVFYLYWV